MDTAGKGGIMRHVVGAVDPQGVHITAFKAPTDEEKRPRLPLAHRTPLPQAGHDRRLRPVALRGRAHRRVRGFSRPSDRAALRPRSPSSSASSSAAGMTIVKVMLHISSRRAEGAPAGAPRPPRQALEVQPRRHRRARLLWHAYQEAYQIAIERTLDRARPGTSCRPTASGTPAGPCSRCCSTRCAPRPAVAGGRLRRRGAEGALAAT